MNRQRLVSALLTVAMACPAMAAAQEAPASPARRKNFTAQQKPRVAVMKFENTNAEATTQGFGASVSAMLTTFLKRQSQLVVVERQNLEAVLGEWKKRQTGMAAGTEIVDPLAPPAPVASPVQLEMLERVEAILDGRVTVLGDCRNDRGQNAPPATQDQCIVEIDARLVSPENAHIIAAGHQSGPRSDLRATVERLGIELEQGLLRPYYGSLSVSVEEPTNARIFLTPILSVNASDDERPAVQLDRTATPQARQVQFEKWVTVPNVAHISSLLAGWYSVRIERPGFESIGVENGRLVVQDAAYQSPRVVQINGTPLTPDQENFIVQILPSETRKWPSRPVRLEKKGGSIAIRVRREYLDREYKNPSELPALKTYLRSENRGQTALLDLNERADLDIAPDVNGSRAAAPTAASEQMESRLDDIKGCTYEVARPVFESFTGGKLVIEDYHRAQPAARKVPTGSYRVTAALPNYVVRSTSLFEVADKVDDRIVQVDLKRLTGSVTVLRADEPRAGSNIVLEGRETKYKRTIPLDFKGTRTVTDLPVDTYDVTTDLPGFNQWSGWFVLANPPTGSKLGNENGKAEPNSATCVVIESRIPAADTGFELKTQPWLAGSVQAMNRFRDSRLSIRNDFTAILLAYLDEEEKKGAGGRANDASSLLVGRPAVETPSEQRLDYMRWYLGQIDLLYLTDTDMSRLQRLPQASKLVRDYIDGGGAVYAFVSAPGNYTAIFGADIPLESKTQVRKETELRPGDVAQVQMDLKLESPFPRELREVRAAKDAPLGWRVVAYRKKGRKEPAILERGDLDKGGYVLVWIDSLGEIPQHDLTIRALTAVESRALMWAQFLMYRRVGPNSQQRADAQANMSTLFSAKGEAKILVPKDQRP